MPYFKLLQELSNNTPSLNSPRMRREERIESKMVYEEVVVPPKPEGLLDRLKVFLALSAPARPIVERRSSIREVRVPIQVEIVTQSRRKFPWLSSFYPYDNGGINEVEHYHDFLLRLRVEEHIGKIGLDKGEARYLKDTMTNFTKFFGSALESRHSVVISLIL